MKLSEALSECVAGARMTAAHMQPGCYIEHSFSRGFVRCWPVDRVEDEPQRTQCDFKANAADEAADWTEVVRPEPVKAPPKWGTGAIPLTDLPPGTYSATFEEVKMTRRGPVVTKIGNVEALAAVGFIIPGATPVIDIDKPVPKRDSWGREIAGE